jgi:uncharacterized protein
MAKQSGFAEILAVLAEPEDVVHAYDEVAPPEGRIHAMGTVPLPNGNKKANRGDDSMKTIDVIALVLLIVGGLNWGLVGLAHFDLVAAIFGLKFGEVSTLTSLVYLLVALSAIYEVFSFKSMQTRWGHEHSPARAR